MKKIMIKISASVMLLSSICVKAQTYTETFEGLTLPVNSFYKDTTGADWQTSNAIFRYDWNYHYWLGGSAYTNITDTTNGTFANLYGNITYKGYSNSNNYVTAQDLATIVLKSPNKIVSGFYITNTTYAYKTMKNGNMFARKFGDTTGTHCGCPQGSYPDFFKVTIKGYSGGVITTDSVEFYLADYRFSNSAQDYIVNNWQWVNCNSLGVVDSIRFFMYSSDVGAYGINTPTFFSIDNLTTSGTAGVAAIHAGISQIYPNPATDKLFIDTKENIKSIKISGINGAVLSYIMIDIATQRYQADITNLETGIYFIEIETASGKFIEKIIKQ